MGTDLGLLCARKPHGRGQIHGWPWESTAWISWGVHALFRAVEEYSGYWSGFSPSPKKARYKRLRIYNFQINEKKKIWLNTNCKQGRYFCTGKQFWPSGTSLRRHGGFLLFFLTPFSLQSTKPPVVSLSGYSWAKPPYFRHIRPGKSLGLDSSTHLCLFKLGIIKDDPNSGLWIYN